MMRALRDQVMARLGPSSRAEVEHAIDITLEGVGASLPRDERYGLLEPLPVELHERMSRSPPEQRVERDELIRAVARRDDLSMGRAAEEVEAVCEALSTLLDADLLERLRRHLPANLGALLEPPPSRGGPPPPRPPPKEASTLAEGRPGSRRPIDEAKG
jgi:uncharacterized protein (DUF2267 family)